MWFPVLSSIVEVIIVLIFFLPLIPLVFSNETHYFDNPLIEYGWLFLFYLSSYFVITFFNTALVTCAYIRLSGGDPTVKDGLNSSIKNIRKIFFWALFTATIGLILKLVAKKGGLLGRFIAGIGNLAWDLVTYLIVPILIFNNVGVIDSFKTSAALFKKTWGEEVSGEITMNTFFGVLSLVPLLGIIIAISIFARNSGAFPFIPVIAAVVIFIVYYIGIVIVSSALQGVFVAALYIFATTNKIPSAFSPEIVEHAFKPKHTKDKEADDTADEILAPLIQK